MDFIFFFFKNFDCIIRICLNVLLFNLIYKYVLEFLIVYELFYVLNEKCSKLYNYCVKDFNLGGFWLVNLWIV